MGALIAAVATTFPLPCSPRSLTVLLLLVRIKLGHSLLFSSSPAAPLLASAALRLHTIHFLFNINFSLLLLF